jgi:hypothetical protein
VISIWHERRLLAPGTEYGLDHARFVRGGRRELVQLLRLNIDVAGPARCGPATLADNSLDVVGHCRLHDR